MSQSYIEYTNGLSGTTFNVPFKYISINDVKALGFDGKGYNSLTISERNASEDTVTLAVAPSAYTSIRLYRSTSTTQLVDFQNGSRLSEADLDTAYQQGLFAAQEITEDASTTQFAAILTAGLQAGTSLSNFKSQEFTADGVASEFTIDTINPQTAVPEAYRVSIDGVMQSPVSAFTIEMSPNKLVFSEVPPVDAEIVIVSAASAASAVSVDDVTIGLTSANKAEIKDLGVTNAKLAGSITQDKLAGSITQDKLAGGITNAQLAGSIATSKLAEVIDDDTMTTGVSSTSLASSESIKAYVDSNGITQTTGTAPYFGCRAFGIFNGQNSAPITPQSSGNVSSIVRTSNGYFEVSFTTPMADANYSVVVTGNHHATVSYATNENVGFRQTGKFQMFFGSTSSLYNPDTISFAVFG